MYIGCGLTHASEEFKSSVVKMRESLRPDFDILDFVGLAAGDSYGVYNHDINKCVKKCNFFVAICDEASIGLGYELSVAVRESKVPTLILAHAHTTLTRLVIGMCEHHSNATLRRYDSMENVAEIVQDWTQQLSIAA